MSLAQLEQNEVFNNLVTTTLKNLQPELVPQIYAERPLLNNLKETGKVQMLDGGLQIGVGIVGEKNPNFEWYQGSTVAVADEEEQFTRALYDWALARIALKISDQDIDMNSGKSQIHNLLSELIENMKSTFADEINVALNTSTAIPKRLMGLANFITTATGVAVGGLDPDTTDSWDNQRITSGVTRFVDSSLPGNLKHKMRELYNMCITFCPAAKRNGMVIISDVDTFESYEASLEEIARFMLTDSRKESLGFGQADTLSFKGKPYFWDDAAPADELRIYNTNFLRLYVHSKRNFSTDPARTPHNAHASVSYMRFMGQLCCNFRRVHGVLGSIADDA